MSAKSWLKEFYPVPASRLSAKKKPISHGILKWRGALPSNLRKHGVKAVSSRIETTDGEFVLAFGAYECALCELYINYRCVECPLSIIRKGVPCCKRKPTGEKISPYEYMVETGDPKPMLKLLKQALKLHPNQ